MRKNIKEFERRELVVGGLIFVAVLGMTYFAVRGFFNIGDVGLNGHIVASPGLDTSAWKKFHSLRYGLDFKYPPKYFLEEKNLGTKDARRYLLTLIEDTPENRASLKPQLPPREGPVSIRVEVFDNRRSHYVAEDWIKLSPDSSFHEFAKTDLATTTFAGGEGVTFLWSEIYEARTTVIAHPDWVYSFTVTYRTPADAILADFNDILSTVRLTHLTP